jgi:hypothetical protein
VLLLPASFRAVWGVCTPRAHLRGQRAQLVAATVRLGRHVGAVVHIHHILAAGWGVAQGAAGVVHGVGVAGGAGAAVAGAGVLEPKLALAPQHVGVQRQPLQGSQEHNVSGLSCRLRMHMVMMKQCMPCLAGSNGMGHLG